MMPSNPEVAPLRRYRVVLRLTEWEWWRLKIHCRDLGIEGSILIAQLLRNLVYELPELPAQPLPDYDPEDV